jgi:hypothetical protein
MQRDEVQLVVPECFGSLVAAEWHVLVHLSNVYSQLRGDQAGQKNEDASQVGVSGLVCVTAGLRF